MLKKSVSEKIVVNQKNRNRGNRGNQFLVSINIMGSAGPIRFVVNEKELVSGVIEIALKSYAREGRLPVLGFDATNFLLYHPNAGFDGEITPFMMEVSVARCHLEAHGIFFSNFLRTRRWENAQKLPCNVASLSSKSDVHRLASSRQTFTAVYLRRPFFCRIHSMPASLKESASLQSEDNSSEDFDPSTDSEDEASSQPLTSKQIMALLTDSERTKLTKKLSEANQQNRFLKRQLYIKEDALVKFKSELAVIEHEVQALARLAEEIARSGIPEGSRKINGKYIHSHLVARLEAVREQLKEQIKGVDAAQSKEVSVFWFGMAESVQVMGSFDGWSQGEHLSPEYTGSYTKFSTTLMLRPGRYEIKFLVDGDWHLSPEFPVTGEGPTENNLLIVE